MARLHWDSHPAPWETTPGAGWSAALRMDCWSHGALSPSRPRPTLRNSQQVSTSARMGAPRSMQEEKGEDAQHSQGRDHYTPVHVVLVHRSASSCSRWRTDAVPPPGCPQAAARALAATAARVTHARQTGHSHALVDHPHEGGQVGTPPQPTVRATLCAHTRYSARAQTSFGKLGMGAASVCRVCARSALPASHA